MANVLGELFPHLAIDFKLGIDNQSALIMTTAPTFSRSRHIELRHFYVRDQVKKANVNVYKDKSVDNPSDIFPKPLPKIKLHSYMAMLGVLNRMHEHSDIDGRECDSTYKHICRFPRSTRWESASSCGL